MAVLPTVETFAAVGIVDAMEPLVGLDGATMDGTITAALESLSPPPNPVTNLPPAITCVALGRRSHADILAAIHKSWSNIRRTSLWSLARVEHVNSL